MFSKSVFTRILAQNSFINHGEELLSLIIRNVGNGEKKGVKIGVCYWTEAIMSKIL